MSDNVAVTPGSGETIAADDVGGAKYQRVKVAHGADGSATDVSTASGLPTDLRTLAGTAIDTNSGAKSAGTVRVVLATDQPQLTNAMKTDGSAVTQPVSVGGNVSVLGVTAADAALTVNPITVGARATNTNLAPMSADGDVVNLQATMQGALVIADAPRELLGVQQTQISSSTSEITIVTAGASGIFNDLYSLILANTSASATKVTIKDATSGTTRTIIHVPAGDTRGFTLSAGSAIPQASAANNWTATCGTSVAALEVTALFVKRK